MGHSEVWKPQKVGGGLVPGKSALRKRFEPRRPIYGQITVLAHMSPKQGLGWANRLKAAPTGPWYAPRWGVRRSEPFHRHTICHRRWIQPGRHGPQGGSVPLLACPGPFPAPGVTGTFLKRRNRNKWGLDLGAVPLGLRRGPRSPRDGRITVWVGGLHVCIRKGRSGGPSEERGLTLQNVDGDCTVGPS